MADDDRRPRDKWLIVDAEPAGQLEAAPDGRRLFRGLLVAAPLGALLWWGLVALWRAFA